MWVSLYPASEGIRNLRALLRAIACILYDFLYSMYNKSSW